MQIFERLFLKTHLATIFITVLWISKKLSIRLPWNCVCGFVSLRATFWTRIIGIDSVRDYFFEISEFTTKMSPSNDPCFLSLRVYPRTYCRNIH
jgi:hypothetical protein